MEKPVFEQYDLIGDIHGNCSSLVALLQELGYQKDQSEIYAHPDNRMVIFLGDLIDRGLEQKETVSLVRSMVAAGNAYCVMGNHEFNALAYATPDPENPNASLRPHSAKNTEQHKAFLDAYEDDYSSKIDTLNWFRTLPMWLDFEDLRVIHACWDEAALNRISKWSPDGLINEEILLAASRSDNQMYHDIEVILKGKELELPRGQHITDKGGIKRHHIRVRWWDGGITNYRDAYIGPEDARSGIPDDSIEGDHLVEYTHDSPPVFLGHYWLDPNDVSLLDFSVASSGGKLVAYRWDGEQKLSNEKFVWVGRM
jgi:hypothetical protein